VTRRDIGDEVERHRLHARLDASLAGLPEPPPTPTVVVDLDAFDANADDLRRRAAGKPLRVASKSLRVPALISRALAVAGFSGILSYSLREALWLHTQGVCDDIVMGYPTVDRAALVALTADESAASGVTLMVDDVAHLDLADAARSAGGPTVRVAIDIDAGLRLGGAHVGPKRSPLYDVHQVLSLAREVVDRPGYELVGVMTYEGQVAGVPDDVPTERGRSLVVRRLKAASVHQLDERRQQIAEALDDLVKLEFWNAGGSGSIESSVGDATVTEVSAGSGLLVPHLFDHYRSFVARPAAFFGLRVVRRPSPSTVTVAGGGLVGSGPIGRDRLPLPWAPPGLRLTGLEGAGEVQTPLTGPTASALGIGDLVWFRHAKSGELAEHTQHVHLVSGDRVVGTVPTYRGTGNAW
jgi:D-serine deaminase-like pyridoxal phosphate-dependent protein